MDTVAATLNQWSTLLGILAVGSSFIFWLASLRYATIANQNMIQDMRVEMGKQGERLNSLEHRMGAVEGKLDMIIHILEKKC